MGVLRWGILVAVLVVAGCANPLTPSISEQYGIPSFANDTEVMNWVHSYLTYEIQPTMLTPEEILALKKGDCKEYSVLMMSIIHEQFGRLPKMIAIVNSKESHAIVEDDGVFYDPTYDQTPENVDIYASISFYSIMRQAQLHFSEVAAWRIG